MGVTEIGGKRILSDGGERTRPCAVSAALAGDLRGWDGQGLSVEIIRDAGESSAAVTRRRVTAHARARMFPYEPPTPHPPLVVACFAQGADPCPSLRLPGLRGRQELSCWRYSYFFSSTDISCGSSPHCSRAFLNITLLVNPPFLLSPGIIITQSTMLLSGNVCNRSTLP